MSLQKSSAPYGLIWCVGGRRKDSDEFKSNFKTLNVTLLLVLWLHLLLCFGEFKRFLSFPQEKEEQDKEAANLTIIAVLQKQITELQFQVCLTLFISGHIGFSFCTLVGPAVYFSI